DRALPGAPAESRVVWGHRWRIAGAALAAVGVLSLAAGIYFGLRTASLSNDVPNRYSDGRCQGASAAAACHSDFVDGQQAATLQWIGYSVGAVGLAGGVALYWYGRRLGAQEAPVTFTPLAGA